MNSMMPLLQVVNISMSYGSVPAVRGASLTVNEKEVVLLLGANGAGKTTLLKGIVGLMPAKEGSVVFDGKDLSNQATHVRIKAGLAYMSEVGIFSDLSIDANLELGGYRLDKHERKARKRAIYDRLSLLAQRKNECGGDLSGGQRKLLGLGKALMGNPKLLILDEPSAGLAPAIVLEIIELLKELRKSEETALLIAEQNVRFLELANRGYILGNGKVVREDEAASLRSSDVVEAEYFGG